MSKAAINRKYRLLPREVMSWLLMDGAWLVGSAAKWYLSKSIKQTPRDFDILVHPENFWRAVMHVRDVRPQHIQFRSFGSICVKQGIYTFDFWPMTLEKFLEVSDKKGPQVAFRFRPRTVIRWNKDE